MIEENSLTLENKVISYSEDEFISEYMKLYEETWHKTESQEDYQTRIRNEHSELLESDAFEKEKSKERYNPKENEKPYSKKELENNIEEEWKFLSNPGYTKYAVSSYGRVALKTSKGYEIIFQDDGNSKGYLKLDPARKYWVNHKIEVYKLIAMGFLGKTFSDGYDVLHKINDGWNCRPSNLILLTRPQHNAVHNKTPIPADKLKEFLKNNQ